MDWPGWALFGLLATTALTAVMIACQMAGWTRLDLPLVLGSLVTPDPDRARIAGFFIHLAAGQVFALGYAAVFALLGRATWWMGLLLGLLHVTVALTIILPLLPGIHPRMASTRAGPTSRAALEPPGLLGLNYVIDPAEPWLPQPADWGTHAVERQELDPESSLNLAKTALELRRTLWKNEVFTATDGGTWRVEPGNLLVCERNAEFLVAVAMGTEPVPLPAGTVLLTAAPLEEDGWLQPNNAAWVLRS